MKTRYILPALFALGTAITSTQTIATGLTYDPYENYYSKHYGTGAESTATQAKVQKESTFNAPYADYYNAYESDKDKIITSVEEADMADPLNYYKW